jgi:hypothetical protein
MYLFASLLLVIALFPTLSGLRGYADAFTSNAVAEGIASDLTYVHPGMSFSFALSSLPPDTTVFMTGHDLVVVSGSASTEIHLGLLLPSLTFLPRVEYVVWLNGTSLEVSSNVRN